MRNSWKYNSSKTHFGVIAISIFIGIISACLIISCNGTDKHKHISADKKTELDGLVEPTNKTVFSNVKTITPTNYKYNPVINATGVITYDPRLQNTISARFNGRIEKLYVRFNFEKVSKGQRIMDIYSPEIVTEQLHFILLLNSTKIDTSLLNAAKEKLQLLGLTGEQIKQIKVTLKPINPLPVFSAYSGHIHDIGISSGVVSEDKADNGMNGMGENIEQPGQVQNINLPSSQSSALGIKEGMYIQTGQSVFSVFSTNQVWAVLNIFPSDASIIKVGDNVSISLETNPTQEITSSISYIEPITGQNAAAVQARIYLSNSDSLKIKIGSLVSVKITAKEISGIWLPRTAVINLGQSQVVFMKSGEYFRTKIIQTGIVTDSLIQITHGLESGEQIAVNAQFLIDSESFINTPGNEE